MVIRTVNELGASIRRLRKQRGWTQDEAARRASVSRRTLVSLENGNERGEVGIALRVLVALDTDLRVEERSGAASRDLLAHLAPDAE